MPDRRRTEKRVWDQAQRIHYRTASAELKALKDRTPLILTARPVGFLFRCPRCAHECRLPAAAVDDIRTCTRCAMRWRPVLVVDELAP